MKNGIRMMAVMVLAAAAGLVQAAEEGWSYKVTPYLWALGQDGEIGIGSTTAEVDVDFLDVAKDLQIGGMLSAEANRGPWSILGDVAYYNLEGDEDTRVGEFEVDVKQWTVQGAAAYSVVKTGNTVLDLGLGGRYMAMKTTLNTPLGTADPEASEGWADPIIVARVRQQFTEKFYGVLYGDIGGFGVSSDLTWHVTAAAGYSLTDSISMLAGYRYLDYDYEEDAFQLDLAEHGIVIGLQFAL